MSTGKRPFGALLDLPMNEGPTVEEIAQVLQSHGNGFARSILIIAVEVVNVSELRHMNYIT